MNADKFLAYLGWGKLAQLGWDPMKQIVVFLVCAMLLNMLLRPVEMVVLGVIFSVLPFNQVLMMIAGLAWFILVVLPIVHHGVYFVARKFNL